MLCPPTQCGLSAAVPRTDQLQLYRVTWLRRHVGDSAVAVLAESNFAQIAGFDDAIELHGVAVGESLPSIAAAVR